LLNTSVNVQTSADGSVVIQPHGSVGPDCAVELRQVLVHAVRRIRPLRLILDLGHVSDLDPINLGSLAALCTVADDDHVTVFLDNASTAIAGQLAAAGIPRQRLRYVALPG
jgi:anti-anti-sigma regulatory factor